MLNRMNQRRMFACCLEQTVHNGQTPNTMVEHVFLVASDESLRKRWLLCWIHAFKSMMLLFGSPLPPWFMMLRKRIGWSETYFKFERYSEAYKRAQARQIKKCVFMVSGSWMKIPQIGQECPTVIGREQGVQPILMSRFEF